MTIDAIISSSTVDDTGGTTGKNHIVTVAAIHIISTYPARTILATACVNRVVTTVTHQDIIAVGAGNFIVAFTAGNRYSTSDRRISVSI